MAVLKLVKPDLKYRTPYLEMLEEWHSAGEEPHPWVLEVDPTDFKALVEKLENFSRGIDVPSDYVPSSAFWAYDQESRQIVGAVNIRHYLNDFLLRIGGHIGYGVRPGERRKGYAARILALALEECRKLKLTKVMLGCYKDNLGSVKTILKNGGVLENEIMEEESGKIVQRYWIDLNS